MTPVRRLTTLLRLENFQRLTSERGATQIGFTDALVAAIVLGILLFVAYLQFATYNAAPPPAPSAAASAHH